MTARKKFLPFALPLIEDEELQAVKEALQSGWITTGPKVKEFEAQFAAYVGSKHAIAVNSCTAAMHLALEAIKLRAGDIVLTTPYTFAATAEVVRYFQATPCFVDVDPDTFNIDPSKLADRLQELSRTGKTSVTKAIIPVHIGGLPCDLDAIRAIARRYNVAVIEDAAHALPTKYKDRMVGALSDFTCFSFYATKTITTAEGGMICTENDEWAERCRIMCLHGISKDAWKRYSDEGSWFYEIVAPGFKYNMTDIAAALGTAQLRKCGRMWKRRAQISERYTEAFSEISELEVPRVQPNVTHAWHLYIVRLKPEQLRCNRNQFLEALKLRKIGVSVHFIPLHIHPYYRQEFGYQPHDFPVAYGLYQRAISLPIYPAMSDEDVEDVIMAVKSTVEDSRR